MLPCRFRVWARLPSSLSKTPLKRELLNIYLTTFFGFRNLGNTSAKRVNFFENLQNLIEISKIQENFQKKIFLSEIITYKLVALKLVPTKERILAISSQCVNKKF